ncbi:MAG: propionate kinase, partial [Candidatus Bathyarchaeia archaeon]
ICSGLERLSIEIDRDRNDRTLGNIESIISSDASKIKVYVIPTNEERVYAEDAAALLEGRYEPYWKYRYSFENNFVW